MRHLWTHTTARCYIFILSLVLVYQSETSEAEEVCLRQLDEETGTVCAGMMSVEDAQELACINGTLALDGESTAGQSGLTTTDQPR